MEKQWDPAKNIWSLAQAHLIHLYKVFIWICILIWSSLVSLVLSFVLVDLGVVLLTLVNHWEKFFYIRNGVMYYKCNNFAHIARDCRLQTNQFGPRYGKRVIACHICNNLGHTTRFCIMNNMRTPNPRINVNNNARRNESVKGNQLERLNKTFVREGTPARTKVWVEKIK